MTNDKHQELIVDYHSKELTDVESIIYWFDIDVDSDNLDERVDSRVVYGVHYTAKGTFIIDEEYFTVRTYREKYKWLLNLYAEITLEMIAEAV